MTSTLLKNLLVVTQNANRDVFSGDILIENDRIARIGRIQVEADNIVDYNGAIAIPGFVNTHAHVAMANMKGIADDMSFDKFLSTTFKYDSGRTENDVEDNALLGMKEMLLSGITTFADLYYMEDAIVRSALKSNIRIHPAWAVLDKEYTTQKGLPLDNCRTFLQKMSEYRSPMVTPAVGIQGIYVASEETMIKARELAKKYNTYVHMHLSETRREVNQHVDKTSMRPVEWLEKIGFLDGLTLAAHSVWLTERELDIYRKNKVNVSHCPTSNMKLAIGGIAPIPEMIDRDITVSIGTDSVVSNNSLNMFWEMKLTALLHKHGKWNPEAIKAEAAFDMATIGGARALNMEDKIGSLEAGKLADIVVLDNKNIAFQPFSSERIISNIVYASDRSAVKDVIVGGKYSVRNGIPLI